MTMGIPLERGKNKGCRYRLRILGANKTSSTSLTTVDRGDKLTAFTIIRREFVPDTEAKVLV